MPNVGRESHTYLYHIVENYDNMADWTVFTQSEKPEWGYDGGKMQGSLHDGVSFENYLEPFPDGQDIFLFYKKN